MKQLRITIDGKSFDVQVEILGEEGQIVQPLVGHGVRPATVAPLAAVPAPSAPKTAPVAGGSGEIPSPLGAVVVSVDVEVGQTVAAGDKIVTLEAMKMNTVVASPLSGTVRAIAVKQGDAVEEGQVLLVVN